MPESILFWSDTPPPTKATITEIDHFDARGMRRVYGRGDSFVGYRRSFNLDIWLHRSGRLMMRCWSGSREIDNRSFEITGIPTSEIPSMKEKGHFEDTWIPEIVRDGYEDWMTSEF